MPLIRARHAFLGLTAVAVLAGGCSSTAGSGDRSAPAATAAASRPAAPPPSASPAPARPAASIKPKPTRGTPEPNVTWTPTAKPKVKPVPTASTVKPGTSQKGVTPGAFCSPQGATGYTRKDARMRCTIKPGDERARWRAA